MWASEREIEKRLKGLISYSGPIGGCFHDIPIKINPSVVRNLVIEIRFDIGWLTCGYRQRGRSTSILYALLVFLKQTYRLHIPCPSYPIGDESPSQSKIIYINWGNWKKIIYIFFIFNLRGFATFFMSS